MGADSTAPFPHTAFFGRQSDLAYLKDRVAFDGITFVSSLPKMGKTWLLQELHARLSSAPEEEGSGYLVGYHESRGGEDLLRYTLQDLYTTWLAQATLRQQAVKAWSDQKGTWLTKAATAVSGLFGMVGDVGGIGKAVDAVLDGLIKADDQLKKGGIEAPELAYEQARDLTALVGGLSKRRVVLIFDAWEKTDNLGAAEKIIGSFLDYIEEWPKVHIVVGLRHPNLDDKGDDPVWHAVQRLKKRSNGTGDIWPLQQLELSDPAEQARLANYVRSAVPAAKDVPDKEIIRMVNGYPGTLERWTRVRGLATAEDLDRAAQDAQANRYAELDSLLPKLDAAQLKLVLRLSLLPRASATSWPLFRPVVEDGLAPDRWIECVETGLLVSTPPSEGDAYPSFGHDTRHAAVARWFTQPNDNTNPYLTRVRQEANQLMLGLAPRLNFKSTDWAVLGFGLHVVRGTVTVGALAKCPRLIAAANEALGGVAPPSALLAFDPWPGTAEERRALAAFFGHAFCNGIYQTLVGASPDLELAWKLLALLRGLQRDYPDQAILRELLARILVNVVYACLQQRRPEKAVEFANELHALVKDEPVSNGLWLQYAWAIYYFSFFAQVAGDQDRAAQIMDDRRALNPPQLDLAGQREWAETLKRAFLVGADYKQTEARLNGWRAELKALIEAGGGDPFLRLKWAETVVRHVALQRAQGNFEGANSDFGELCQLGTKYPQDDQIAILELNAAAILCFWIEPWIVLTDWLVILMRVKALGERFPDNKEILAGMNDIHTRMAARLRTASPSQVPDLPSKLAQLDGWVPLRPAPAPSRP